MSRRISVLTQDNKQKITTILKNYRSPIEVRKFSKNSLILENIEKRPLLALTVFDLNGDTLLHHVLRGNADFVVFQNYLADLLDNYLDQEEVKKLLNAKNKKGTSILDAACKYFKKHQNEELIKWLVSKGCDPLQVNNNNNKNKLSAYDRLVRQSRKPELSHLKEKLESILNFIDKKQPAKEKETISGSIKTIQKQLNNASLKQNKRKTIEPTVIPEKTTPLSEQRMSINNRQKKDLNNIIINNNFHTNIIIQKEGAKEKRAKKNDDKLLSESTQSTNVILQSLQHSVTVEEHRIAPQITLNVLQQEPQNETVRSFDNIISNNTREEEIRVIEHREVEDDDDETSEDIFVENNSSQVYKPIFEFINFEDCRGILISRCTLIDAVEKITQEIWDQRNLAETVNGLNKDKKITLLQKDDNSYYISAQNNKLLPALDILREKIKDKKNKSAVSVSVNRFLKEGRQKNEPIYLLRVAEINNMLLSGREDSRRNILITALQALCALDTDKNINAQYCLDDIKLMQNEKIETRSQNFNKESNNAKQIKSLFYSVNPANTNSVKQNVSGQNNNNNNTNNPPSQSPSSQN